MRNCEKPLAILIVVLLLTGLAALATRSGSESPAARANEPCLHAADFHLMRPVPKLDRGQCRTGDHKTWMQIEVMEGGRVLRMDYFDGVCEVLDRTDVRYERLRIIVTNHHRSRGGGERTCYLVGLPRSTTVHLREPVGKREIVDGGMCEPGSPSRCADSDPAVAY